MSTKTPRVTTRCRNAPRVPRSALEHHIAFVGKTGSGKTGSAKSGIIEPALVAGERVCVIDPTGAWWGLRLAADGKKPGFPIYVFGGDHGDFPLMPSQGEMIAAAIGETSTPAILDTTNLKTGERMRFFTDFADAILRVNRGPLRLVIDEAHLFAPQAGTRGAGAMPDMLHAANNLISLGRSRGLRVVLISQRPAKVHKDSLTQVESLVAMRLIAPQDRKAIEEWIADQADKDKGKEIIASLPTLKTGEAWVWAPEADFLKRVQFPMPTTYDSSRVQAAGSRKRLSPIDVEKLQAQFAKVKDEAAARDPAALQKRVRELETRLSKQAETVPGAPKKEQLEKIKAAAVAEAKKAYAPLRSALEAAMKFIVEINARDFFKQGGEAIDKKAIEKAIADATAQVGTLIERHMATRDRQLTSVKSEAEKLVAKLQSLIAKADEDVKISVDVTHNKPFTIAPTARAAAAPRKPAPARAGGDDAMSWSNGGAGLTGPQRQLLQALAWWAGMGHPQPSRPQLAAKARWKAKGSNLRNRLSELSSQGLVVYPREGVVELTEAGSAAAPSPDMTETLVDSIKAICTGPQLQLFEQLLVTGTTPRTREDLAGAVGWEPGGSNLRNRLSELSALEVVTYPSKGEVALQGWVVE